MKFKGYSNQQLLEDRIFFKTIKSTFWFMTASFSKLFGGAVIDEHRENFT